MASADEIGFIASTGEMKRFVDRIDAVWKAIAHPGHKPVIYHWSRELNEDALPGNAPTQREIPDKANPVFVLLGNRIGTPLRPLGTEAWNTLPTWLSQNGWGNIALIGQSYGGRIYQGQDTLPDGMIPMTGTLYELFCALRNDREIALRVFDLRHLVPAPGDRVDRATQLQSAWARSLLDTLAGNYAHTVLSPRSDEEFDELVNTQLRHAFDIPALDPVSDELPGLAAVSSASPLLFARQETIGRLSDRILGPSADWLTLLTGASGAGKSSLLRGGLLKSWYRRTPRGIGLARGLRTLVVDPDGLCPGEEDPLEALAAVLSGALRGGCEGPAPGPVALPPSPAPSGNRMQDLEAALAWWHGAVLPQTGPLVLLLDQAEQVDARARRAAEALSQQLGREIPPALDDGWWRFAALLAAVTRHLPASFPATLQTEEALRTHVVLSVDRLSALDLWPLQRGPDSAAFVVPPLARKSEFEDVIRSTCKMYGFRIEDALVDSMADEASGLADAYVAVSPELESARMVTPQAQASVLPQVKTALFLIMSRWRQLRAQGAIAPDDLALDHARYADVAQVDGAIDTLGEAAISLWLLRAADVHGVDAASHDGREFLAALIRQHFGGLMRALVDAGDRGRITLTAMNRTSPLAQMTRLLSETLLEYRLLSVLEGRLRLPHRSILDHWETARNCLQQEARRLKHKHKLRRDYEDFLDEDDFGDTETNWGAERLAGAFDLAINWIGPDLGEDAAFRQWLNTRIARNWLAASTGHGWEGDWRAAPLEAVRGGAFALFDALVAAAIEAGTKVPAIVLECFLIDAAEWGAETALPRLLDQGIGPDFSVEELSALTLAAQNGHEGAVARLLAAGADVDATCDADGMFPLLMAAQNGHDTIVARLIEAGADLDRIAPRYGDTPLVRAAQNGHAPVVAQLIAAGAQIDPHDPELRAAPILAATAKGHASVVGQLIDAGASLDVVLPEDGTSLLNMAVSHGQTRIVARLIEEGIDVNAADEPSGNTALVIACSLGHPSIVDMLIDAGADPFAGNEASSYTPLIAAAESGQDAVVQRLIGLGADVNLPSRTTRVFPLMLAAKAGHLDVVTALLETGAEVNAAGTEEGAPALLAATQEGHVEVVEALLAAGADPNLASTRNGYLPLLSAVLSDRPEIVACLLGAGANVDAVGPEEGIRALHYAAWHGNDAIVAQLIAAGADLDARETSIGASALLIAAQEGHAEIVLQLLEAGAAPDVAGSENGPRPIEGAWQNGQAVIVEKLLAAGAHPPRADMPLRNGSEGRAAPASQPNPRDNGSVTGRMPVFHEELPLDFRQVEEQELQALSPQLASAMRQAGLAPEIAYNLAAPARRADLHSGALQVLMIDFLYDYGAGEVPLRFTTIIRRGADPIPITPGMDCDRVARSLVQGGHLVLRDPTAAHFWAAVVLLTALPSRHALPREPQALPFDPARHDKLMRLPTSFWRPWRTVAHPDGVVVELPWLVGGGLERGAVRVPYAGAGARVVDGPAPQPLARDVDAPLNLWCMTPSGERVPLRRLFAMR